MMMDILYRDENFDTFVKKLLPHIDPSNSLHFESDEDEPIVHRESVENDKIFRNSPKVNLNESESHPEDNELVEDECSDELYSEYDVDFIENGNSEDECTDELYAEQNIDFNNHESANTTADYTLNHKEPKCLSENSLENGTVGKIPSSSVKGLFFFNFYHQKFGPIIQKL